MIPAACTGGAAPGPLSTRLSGLDRRVERHALGMRCCVPAAGCGCSLTTGCTEDAVADEEEKGERGRCMDRVTSDKRVDDGAVDSLVGCAGAAYGDDDAACVDMRVDNGDDGPWCSAAGAAELDVEANVEADPKARRRVLAVLRSDCVR